MNMNAPVSGIMSTELYTLSPVDSLAKVKELFEAHNIHHLPVVQLGKIVGIISKADFNKVLHGSRLTPEAAKLDDIILNNYTCESIMTDRLAKISPNDKIGVAAEIFLDNLIHALPVVDAEGLLVGLVTTYDIIHFCFHDAYPRQDIAELS
jgi:acetoin utilization protein AcuB